MPRVTKEMLESQVHRRDRVIEQMKHEIELLKMQVKLMGSSYSLGGQISSMVIAIERLGDALAHVLKEPVMKEIRKDLERGQPMELKMPL